MAAGTGAFLRLVWQTSKVHPSPGRLPQGREMCWEEKDGAGRGWEAQNDPSLSHGTPQQFE